jgi:hypothetical protein
VVHQTNRYHSRDILTQVAKKYNLSAEKMSEFASA